MEKTTADQKADAQGAEKKDWAEMSDEEGENDTAGAAEEQEPKQAPEPKKVIPATQKGTKNKQGDYIVEKFEITDFRDDIKKNKENESEDDESSSDDYGNEDDQKNDDAPV